MRTISSSSSTSTKLPGSLIVIEGIDGSGKSTLAHGLFEAIRAQGYPVLLTKEPGGTALGKKIRELVHDPAITRTPLTEFLLFAADRAEHIATFVRPALEQGTFVISDRMTDSSLVYQGYGKGLNIEQIKMVNRWVMQDIVPTKTIYLNVPTDIARKRIAQRNQTLTSFEQEDHTFTEKLINGFETIYKNRSDVITIDGTQQIEACVAQALEKLTPLLTR